MKITFDEVVKAPELVRNGFVSLKGKPDQVGILVDMHGDTFSVVMWLHNAGTCMLSERQNKLVPVPLSKCKDWIIKVDPASLTIKLYKPESARERQYPFIGYIYEPTRPTLVVDSSNTSSSRIKIGMPAHMWCKPFETIETWEKVEGYTEHKSGVFWLEACESCRIFLYAEFALVRIGKDNWYKVAPHDNKIVRHEARDIDYLTVDESKPASGLKEMPAGYRITFTV